MSKEFKTIDELMGFYEKNMPKNVVLVKNRERYAEILKSIEALNFFIKSISPDAVVEITMGDIDPSAIYYNATVDEIIIYKVKEFCEAISTASNFEIYPKSKSKIQLSILFDGGYEAAPPHNDPFPGYKKSK